MRLFIRRSRSYKFRWADTTRSDGRNIHLNQIFRWLLVISYRLISVSVAARETPYQTITELYHSYRKLFDGKNNHFSDILA